MFFYNKYFNFIVCIILVKIGQIIRFWNNYIKYNFILSVYNEKSLIEYHIHSLDMENIFKDSGYWDYFILIFYDINFRLFFSYTLFLISDYSIIEKASWRNISMLIWPMNIYFYSECKNLNDLLVYIILWLVISMSIIWFFYSLLIIF